ncbi:MAG: DUF3592 domain-containing protein [Candidatus Kariarchaeaceae archaeon]
MSQNIVQKILNYIWIPILYIFIFVVFWILQDPISDSIGSVILNMQGWDIDPQTGSAIIGAFVFLFSVAALSYFYRAYLVGKASMNWPTVDGKIISLQSPGIGAIQLLFTYTVDGVKYIANTRTIGELYSMSFSTTSSAQTKAGLVAQEYPEGKSVTVYYDSNNPERKMSRSMRSIGMDISEEFKQGEKLGTAVLVPGYSRSKSLGGMLLGLVLGIVGELLLFVAFIL